MFAVKGQRGFGIFSHGSMGFERDFAIRKEEVFNLEQKSSAKEFFLRTFKSSKSPILKKKHFTI